MSLELRAATELSDEELADLFTASYEGYLLPLAVRADVLRFLTAAFDLDRGASSIAVRDGEPVGLVNLGLRGREAWIGGLGVVPGERRRGTGRALMRRAHEEARERGVKRVQLEVIVENTQARALYEELSYTRVRDLDVWSAPGSAGPVAVVPVEQARRTIANHRVVREPWQRADATVDNLDDVVGVEVAGAAALARVSNGRVQLLRAGGTSESLPDVVRAAAALGDSLQVLNVDPADPLAAALHTAGGRVDVAQHELELRLAT